MSDYQTCKAHRRSLGGGSGRRGPDTGDAEDLIGGEGEDAEHEVAF
jgi:hypothetical protein